MTRILVIEDQAPMRRNLSLMLKMEGFEVFAADNGRAGLELARREKPDVILCDVMMPGEDYNGLNCRVVTQFGRARLQTSRLAWMLAGKPN